MDYKGDPTSDTKLFIWENLKQKSNKTLISSFYAQELNKGPKIKFQAIPTKNSRRVQSILQILFICYKCINLLKLYVPPF